jgi:hypothetical protein
MTQGRDPFEQSSAPEVPRAMRILDRCGGCHNGSGIYTVRSYPSE